MAIWANSTLTLAVKIAKTRIMNPISVNKPRSIILILFDILIDSDSGISLSSNLLSVVPVILPTILSLKPVMPDASDFLLVLNHN